MLINTAMIAMKSFLANVYARGSNELDDSGGREVGEGCLEHLHAERLEPSAHFTAHSFVERAGVLGRLEVFPGETGTSVVESCGREIADGLVWVPGVGHKPNRVVNTVDEKTTYSNNL